MNVEEYDSHHSNGDDDSDTVEEYNSLSPFKWREL